MAPHILIVDSHSSAAQVTRAGVRRAVPEATLAVEPDPERGLLSLECRRPDVLIIDPPRHNMAVTHLIRKLKAGSHESRVIVLASTPALRRELLQLGVDVYLQKPAPLALVLDSLRSALESIRTRLSPEARTVLPPTEPSAI